MTVHLQNSIMKDTSFTKKTSELGLMSPLSPRGENARPQDPMEFPRNRLYIFPNRVLGTLTSGSSEWLCGLPEWGEWTGFSVWGSS